MDLLLTGHRLIFRMWFLGELFFSGIKEKEKDGIRCRIAV